MMVNDQDEFGQVSGVCWLATGEAESLAMSATEVSSLNELIFQAGIPAAYAFLADLSHVLYKHTKLCRPILPIHGWSRTTTFGYRRGSAKGELGLSLPRLELTLAVSGWPPV
jgi:hypothetical protein